MVKSIGTLTSLVDLLALLVYSAILSRSSPVCVTYPKLLFHLLPHISLVSILASSYVMAIYQLL